MPARSPIPIHRDHNKKDCQLWKFFAAMPFLWRARGPKCRASPLKGAFCPSAPSTENERNILFYRRNSQCVETTMKGTTLIPRWLPWWYCQQYIPAGWVALPNQGKPTPSTLPPTFPSALALEKAGPYTPHPQQPPLSGNTPPLWPLRKLFSASPHPLLSSILLCLVSLFPSPFRGLQLRTGRNSVWYRWLEGEDFWHEKTSRAGHLAQSEFTLGSPQLEIVSSLARVPQRPNKTLGKQQVSTR